MVASSKFELRAALAAADPLPAVEASPRHANGWQWLACHHPPVHQRTGPQASARSRQRDQLTLYPSQSKNVVRVKRQVLPSLRAPGTSPALQQAVERVA
jgi:hypothetical protein